MTAEGEEEAADALEEVWWWQHPKAEMIMTPGAAGREMDGAGLEELVVRARRMTLLCGSRAALRRRLGWEIAAGRAQSSNNMWAVRGILDVERPAGRRGLQLGGWQLVTIQRSHPCAGTKAEYMDCSNM